MKKILLPYFKIKSRIIKLGKYFKIGEIGFKVTGISPGKKGVITSKTFLHCHDYYSLNTNITRALLLTTKKYDNFDAESLVKEIMSSDRDFLINKNQLVQIKQYEFYVRNCEPDTGVLTTQSQITIENKEIHNITKVKVAVIKVT